MRLLLIGAVVIFLLLVIARNMFINFYRYILQLKIFVTGQSPKVAHSKVSEILPFELCCVPP